MNWKLNTKALNELETKPKALNELEAKHKRS